MYQEVHVFHFQFINRSTKVKEVAGKYLSAMTVFTEVIRFLKDQLLGTLQKRKDNFVVKDIMFVLTVPAIWTDRAKKFMREAAMEVS